MAKLANSMPHVVILLESTYPTHTQILRGILRFTQLHAPWTLDVRTGRAGEPTSFGAEKWKVDGIIGDLSVRENIILAAQVLKGFALKENLVAHGFVGDIFQQDADGLRTNFAVPADFPEQTRVVVHGFHLQG